MRILVVASKHIGGRPEYGLSFEYNNFLLCLVAMGHEVLFFDSVGLLERHGREAMNRRLVEVVEAEKPSMLFAVLVDEELDRSVVREISDRGETATCCWFCDDHHRFERHSRHWAPCFHRVVTTAHSALPAYEAAGFDHVIASQWATNPFLYRRLDLHPQYEASFVGMLHGNRREILQSLGDRGIPVDVWGPNTPRGPLASEEMIAVFNQSRINLNLSGASVSPDPPSAASVDWRVRLRGWASQLPIVGPLGRRLRARQRGRKLAPDQLRDALATPYVQQIKGRNFEVPGCGGFQLTGRVENITDYFVEDREIVLYDSFDDLADKARYYLEHEEARAAIAEAGYQRCRREHTYVHRFHEIFRHLGLPVTEIDLDAPPSSGTLEELA